MERVQVLCQLHYQLVQSADVLYSPRSTYYAVIVAEREGSVASIDARPSDALNLAVLAGSPVLVATDVVVGSEAGRKGTPIYARLNQHMRDGTATSAAAVASEARENWEKSLAEFSKHEEST